MIQDAIKAALDGDEAPEEEVEVEDEVEMDEPADDAEVEIDTEEETEELEERREYKGDDKKMEEVKKELNESIKVIKTLRSELNEVNLLNAKLIYVNKIFKSNELNENQKVKVVNSFDKAKTLNEAKNIYEVLKDNLVTKKAKKNSVIKESKQFASAVVGVKSANQPIVADDMITRMQLLAGIKNND